MLVPNGVRYIYIYSGHAVWYLWCLHFRGSTVSHYKGVFFSQDTFPPVMWPGFVVRSGLCLQVSDKLGGA